MVNSSYIKFQEIARLCH
uniref:Uncharacterized protein n=1 Tax=Timema shepardi TaxID=629360 RepID=A0A7R9B8S5_TIMSH|nr:unnamed protein product [Timema shepardi]